MRQFLAVLLILAGLVGLARSQTYSPPVSSVNGQQGAVTVPTLCRQTSTAITPDGSGNVTWTFTNPSCAFAANPTCFSEVTATNTAYIFSFPVAILKSAAAVTYALQAAQKILNISIGALTVWGNPPSGTTVVLTCVAPPA